MPNLGATQNGLEWAYSENTAFLGCLRLGIQKWKLMRSLVMLENLALFLCHNNRTVFKLRHFLITWNKMSFSLRYIIFIGKHNSNCVCLCFFELYVKYEGLQLDAVVSP